MTTVDQWSKKIHHQGAKWSLICLNIYSNDKKAKELLWPRKRIDRETGLRVLSMELVILFDCRQFFSRWFGQGRYYPRWLRHNGCIWGYLWCCANVWGRGVAGWKLRKEPKKTRDLAFWGQSPARQTPDGENWPSSVFSHVCLHFS